MYTSKNMDKMERVILNYFKLVNPLPYDKVKIDMRLSEILAFVEIKIYAEDSISYTSQRGREKCVVEKIRKDMNDMFPYTFQVRVNYNYSIDKKLKNGIRTNH